MMKINVDTVIVTGAGGFLGSHLSENFLKLGYRVIAVDNFCTGSRANRIFLEKYAVNNAGALMFFEADVSRDWEWISDVPETWLNNLKYVLHFASPSSPPQYQKLSFETIWVNTKGLEYALKIAENHNARVIFASTSEVYGDSQVHPQDESYFGNVNSFGPRACYDESKRLGETLIYEFNKKHFTKHGVVRIFNTYGPQMALNDGRVVVNFIHDALKLGKIRVYGDGKKTRCFCYVEDLIEGIYRYAVSDVCVPVNIGSEKEISVFDLAQFVQKQLGSETVRIQFESLPEEDPKVRRPSLLRAKKMLDGWDESTSLESGIQQMISWMKSPEAEQYGSESSKL